MCLANADDSGSMAFEEGGERIDDMKAVLGRTADAATLFDTDGIVVRFIPAPPHRAREAVFQCKYKLPPRLAKAGSVPTSVFKLSFCYKWSTKAKIYSCA